MLELKPYKLHHLFNLYPRIRGDVKGLPLNAIIRHANIAASSGPSYAAVDGDYCIAVGGVFPVNTGTAQMWIIGSDDIKSYAKSFTQLIKNERDPMMKEHGYHRLQAEVLCEHPHWIRWAKSFGMESEGRMKKYTWDGKDCVLMAYTLGE